MTAWVPHSARPATRQAPPVRPAAWPPDETTPPPAPDPTGRGPGRSPTSTELHTIAPSPMTRTGRLSTAPSHPHTTRRSTTPSRSRSTPSPAPAKPGDAVRSGPYRRSPHRPDPAETPGSTTRPTPDPTNDDPRPASTV